MPESTSEPFDGFEGLSRLARFEAVIEATARAYDKGVLEPLPQAAGEVITDALIASRLCTVRTRLYLLGYLKSDNGSPCRDHGLDHAILRFQEEAGLTVDGWVGPESWTALQQLVTFEEPTHLEAWVNRPEAQAALRRAVGLRLHALGLLDEPTRDLKRIRAGLRTFAGVAAQLHLSSAALEPDLTLATLNPLFDQEGLVSKLSLLGDATLQPSAAPEVVAARRFVTQVGRVELWLHGYDIFLDRDRRDLDAHGQIRLPPEDWDYRDEAYADYRALYHFWLDSGQYAAKARQSAVRAFDGAFFRRLVAMAESDGEPEARLVEMGPQIYETIALAAQEKASLWDEIWKKMREIGSRMWDGVRRAWRWFTGILAKAAPYLGWARNLARLAYLAALKVFTRIRQAVARIADSADSFLRQMSTGSEPPRVVVWHERDLDYFLVAQDGDAAARLRQVTAQMLRRARNFNLAIRVVAILARTILDLIKLIMLPGMGWLIYVLALARAARELWPLVREISALESA